MSNEQVVCKSEELALRQVVGAGDFAVGRTGDGELFGLSRRCRHLRADLAEGSVDKAGCLVCPKHGARFDVETGKMVRGPQGLTLAVETIVRTLSGWFPQSRGNVSERDGTVCVD